MAAVTRALMSSRLSDRYLLEAVPTYKGPEPLRRLGIYILAMLRLISWSLRGRGRIVHVHATSHGSMYRKSVCVLVAKALRRRVILHMHSGPGDILDFRAGLGPLSLALFRRAARAADVVLAVSNASAAAFAESYGVEGILVVPTAAPEVPDFIRPARLGDAARAIYLGGFAETVKGGDVLVEALALDLPWASGLQVALAGPGELPEPGRRLLADNSAIEWLGWLEPERRDEALRDADLFLLVSRSEGLPVALLEAMAHGLAIVATRVGGIPEVIEDGEQGVIVTPDAPAEIAEAMSRLATDTDLRVRLGNAARERATRLNTEEVTERLDGLYARLL
jgi:glycosyltransferase involved in cell wall biosynthesis